MNNTVTLSFNKSLTNLAGYDYGKQVYEEQVAGNIDLESEFTIEFPPGIKGVAASFVQGLFKDIVDKIGLSATETRMIILSDNNLEDCIKKKLL